MNLERLKTKVPANIMEQIPAVMEKFKINTPLRLAHFLAQCAHESGNFSKFTENLNYSTDGLLTVFPKYFRKADGTPDRALAEKYARNPEKIGARVYASRMGNGDESTGEGFKFRGRGAIQLTGKDNYKAFDQFVDEDLIASPELVASKYPLLSAAWFWDKTKLNAISDKGATDDVVKQVTIKVNGGTHGLADRISKFKLFYAELS
jgi:putative chitinase